MECKLKFYLNVIHNSKINLPLGYLFCISVQLRTHLKCNHKNTQLHISSVWNHNTCTYVPTLTLCNTKDIVVYDTASANDPTLNCIYVAPVLCVIDLRIFLTISIQWSEPGTFAWYNSRWLNLSYTYFILFLHRHNYSNSPCHYTVTNMLYDEIMQ